MGDTTPDPNTGDGEGQAGAPGQGQEFTPPKDGSWVPRERLSEVVHEKRALEQELATLRQQASAAVPQQQTPDYTREQLQAFVDSGQITDVQAQDILDTQRERRLKRETEQIVTSAIHQQSRTEAVGRELQRYTAVIPDLMDEGSEARSRVLKEYRYLVTTLGLPEGVATEVNALRNVYGDPALLGRGEVPREPSEEVGGGERPSPGQDGGEGVPKGLSADEKRYYQALIDKGMYKGGWKDVEAELKFANEHLRRKMGAKV